MNITIGKIIKNLIIESIKDQQAIFGDDLFENITASKIPDAVYKEPEPMKFEIAEKNVYFSGLCPKCLN